MKGELEDSTLDYYKKKESEIKKRLQYGNVDAKWDSLLAIENPKVKDRIIVVGAVENNMRKEGMDWGIFTHQVHDTYSIAPYSNCGDRVDILAPGGGYKENTQIFSTIKNGYGYSVGTSMAAPHVAGVAAMIFSIYPDIAPEKVKEIIKETGTGSYGKEGYHLLNAKAAVEKAIEEKKNSEKTETNTIQAEVDHVDSGLTVEESLSDYADQFTYLYGNDLTAYAYWNGDSIDKELRDFNDRKLGYLIYDLDRDSEDELLLVNKAYEPRENMQYTDKYCIELMVCEKSGEGVVPSANTPSKVLIPMSGADKESNRNAFLHCFITDDDIVTINLETYDYANLFADGTGIYYWSFQYMEDGFIDTLACCNYAASELSVDRFTSEFKDTGISGYNAEEIFEGKKHLFEYVSNYLTVCRADSENPVAYGETSKFYNKEVDELAYGTLHFSEKTDEFVYNDGNSSYVSDDGSIGECLAAYAEILGSKNGDVFALAYVDDDELPELITADSEIYHFNIPDVQTYMNGHVTNYMDGEQNIWPGSNNGLFIYEERTGNIWSSGYSNGGSAFDTFYTVNKGVVVDTIEFVSDMREIRNGSTGRSINGIDVSDEEYQNQRNMLINTHAYRKFGPLEMYPVNAANIADMQNNPASFVVTGKPYDGTL